MAKRTTDLTDAQRRAIAAMVAGANQKEAADMAGVDRHTLANWLRGDPQFIAELNAQRFDMQADNIERLRGLGAAAVGVVASALTSDDPKAQLRAAALVLRILGLSEVTPVQRADLDVDTVVAQLEDRKLRDLLAKVRRVGAAQQEPP